MICFALHAVAYNLSELRYPARCYSRTACTTKYVWFDPGAGDTCPWLWLKSPTLGIVLARCRSALMIVDGRESLPMVAGAEMTGLPSGPYVMLLAFHNLSNSQASLALTDDQSAALCNSDVGLGADGVVER